MTSLDADVIIVGAGPAGLATAAVTAGHGLKTIVVEQSAELGSPIRTSGGSFIHHLQSYGIPESLYHPISYCRIASPNNHVSFGYDDPVFCVLDVCGLIHFLAAAAITNGATLMLKTSALDVCRGSDCAIETIVRTSSKQLRLASKVVVDATGYRAYISRRYGLGPTFTRFGLGAEFDFDAPQYDQSEAVLAIGEEVAASGYAWAFPWGNSRVRIGVGIGAGGNHHGAGGRLRSCLTQFITTSSMWHINLEGARPIEYHYGLIPLDETQRRLVGDRILAVGDAAAQASPIAGEGIRWALTAGQMAGKVIVAAARANNYSQQFLARYERLWQAKHGRSLRLAHQMSRQRATWSDQDRDAAIHVLKLLTPAQFAHLLETRFTLRCIWQLVSSNPRLLQTRAPEFVRQTIFRHSQSTSY